VIPYGYSDTSIALRQSFIKSLTLHNLHRVRKKRLQFSLHNFDKFRHSFVIFDMNLRTHFIKKIKRN